MTYYNMNPEYQLPLTNGAFLVDNSFIEYLVTCPRKTEYKYLAQRTPSIEKPALNFGQAIHMALEYRYSVCQNRSVTPEDEQIVHDKILAPFFAANPPPEGDHRTLDWAFQIFHHYNMRYAVEPWKLLKWKVPKNCPHCQGIKVLFRDEENQLPEPCFWCQGTGKQEVITELTFSIPLYTRPNGLQIIYIGRQDLPVLWDDMLIVDDHKTASSLGTSYFEGQKVSPQFEGYCWALEEILKQNGISHRIAGYCINAIRTKEQPAKPRNGWDAWWSEAFERHKEYLRPGQLDEWKENTINLIEEFFFHFEKGVFPQKKKACTMYGKCPYYDVCYLPREARATVLNSNQFVKETWTPLKSSQITEV